MVVFFKFLILFFITQSFLLSKEMSEEEFINTLNKYTIKEQVVKEKINKISSSNFSKYQNIYNEKKIYVLMNYLVDELEDYEVANYMCQLIFLEKNKINEKVNKNKKNDIYKELENCNIEFTEKRNDIDKIVNVFKDVALFMKTNKLEWIVLN